MVVVTGATGKLGRLTVERLATKVPVDQIGVSVRDSSKATGLSERGIRVRVGDFADPASLLHAFEGASLLLLISSNSSGAAAVDHHRNAIHAAQQAGAKRVLYTSHMGASVSSAFAPMRDHAATEAALQELQKTSGLAFTSLRNGFYASSVLMMMGPFLKTGKVVAPQDGPVSWTTHEDLADATVLALTEEGRLDGITPPLTGPEALDMQQLVGLASELTGRAMTRVTISDEEQRSSMVSRGTAEAMVELFAGLYKASRANEFSAVDAALQNLLGRPPISMRQVLKDLVETQQ